MNLGLLDILTAQQAERPAFKGGNNASERPVPSNIEKEFKDYVKNEVPNNANVINDITEALPQKNDDINALIALANNNIDTSKLPSGFGKDDLINILKALKSQNINLNQIDFSDENFIDKILSQLKNINGDKAITNLNSLVQNSGTNAANTNFGNQILNNLLSLQEAEGLQTQIIPPQDIMKKFGEAVSSFSNEVAQAGLQTSANSQVENSANTKLETIATTQLENITKLENIDDIELAKIPLGQVPNDLIQAQTNTQSLSGFTNIAEGNIAKLAENVLQTAKVNAEEPQLLQTDVKSGQIESLLNLKSNEKQSNTEISNTSSKDAAILDKIAANNAQNTTETNKQLQNQLDNQKVADSKAAVNSVQNNGSQLQNNLSNNDSNGFRNSSESFAQTFSNNSAEAPAATGEFTKFQKYVDTISNNIKNMGTDKAAKAQDVLAQIKFGISSINSKASNKITIQLHPKELGSVDVRMDIGNDGKTKVAIMTEKIDTLNLLQKESGSLKGLLQDALQTQSSDLSFSFHEQSDEKWKEIIQEAFGDSNVQNNEEDEGINNMSDSSKYYSNNMLMTDGLDISV